MTIHVDSVTSLHCLFRKIDYKSDCLSVRVCVSVCACLSATISLELHVQCSPIFVHVTYGRGSVLLWRLSDKIRISGFVDDVISPPLRQ